MPRDTGNRRPQEHARPAGGTRRQPEKGGGGARAAKLIARAGLCSRREAEIWIAQGRVAINGIPLAGPGQPIQRGDKITVDGKPLRERARTRLFLFHKPRGLVCTANDPQGRPTIFEHLRQHWPQGPRVISVGRLDINSEGLLLLTNDGGLARVLELPSTGWIRRYRVRAKGQIAQASLDGLRGGVTVAGVRYAGIEASLDRLQGANCWLSMALREGKYREIKHVLESLGLNVNRLIRISYGPFQLGDLEQGMAEEVPTRVLRDRLGASLAKAAGADFSSPLPPQDEREEPESRTQLARRATHAGRRKSLPARAQPAPLLPPAEERKPPRRRRKHISLLRALHRGGFENHTPVEHATIEDRAGRRVRVENWTASTEDPGKSNLRQRKPPRKIAPGKRKQHEKKLRRPAQDKSPDGHKNIRPAGGRPGPRRRRKS